MATKRQDLADRFRAAAERHVPLTLQLEQRHRLASEPDLVSRRQRKSVMSPGGGGREFYVEILPQGSVTLRTSTGGEAQDVGHTFSMWFIYGYEDAGSRETFDRLTEGVAPAGVAVELRGLDGYQTTPDGKVLYQQPDFDDGQDLIPLGTSGGDIDRAHLLTGTVRIDDFDR